MFFFDYDERVYTRNRLYINNIYHMQNIGEKNYIDGVELQSNTSKSFEYDFGLCLFWGALIQFVIHDHLIIRKNGVLIRDFYPCIRKVDNRVGFYDLTGSICPLTNTPFYEGINNSAGLFAGAPV